MSAVRLQGGGRDVALALALACLLSLPSVALPGVAHAESQPPSDHDDFEGPEDLYDPYEGMDPSGRIPAIDKPEDLPNPRRWRYIPEGRIKPGNFFERFLVTSFVVPIVFRSPDTGVGGGLGVTDIDFRAQRRREFAGLFLAYTSEGQQSYWGLWRRWLHHIDLPDGGVLQEERSYIGASGGYQKTLTRRFFGFGPNSKKNNEIRYTDELVEAEVELQMAIPEPGANLVGVVGVRAEYHKLSTDAYGCNEFYGSKGAPCPGAWNQTSVFRFGVDPATHVAGPDFPGDADSYERQVRIGSHSFIDNDAYERNGYLIAGLRWDTRDSQRNPYGGWEVGGRIEAPLLQNDRDVGARFGLGASGVLPVPGIFHSGAVGDEENPPTDVVAGALNLWLTAGDMPFTGLPNLGGGNTLRGYQSGRFRDDAAWHSALEWRVWVIPRGFEITPTIRVERIGVAPFVEAGTVGPSSFSLFESEVKFSYGIGLRILLERAAPFRVDVGFSDEGYQWVARFGYSF